MRILHEETQEIKTGVTRGSIIFLHLSIIYKNDISTSRNLFDLIIYADDTTLTIVLRTFENHSADDKFIYSNTEFKEISDRLKMKYNMILCEHKYSKCKMLFLIAHFYNL